MKLHLSLICALSAACCSEAPPERAADPTSAVSAEPLVEDYAIFPAELGEQVRWLGYTGAASYWTPSIADIAPLEVNLGSLLRAATPEQLDDHAQGRTEYQEYLRGELDLILERLPDYRRQYVGVVDAAGRRLILVRAFAGSRFDGGFEFERWREELAIVSDGGFWYWYAVYDPAIKRLVYFRSNGYA